MEEVDRRTAAKMSDHHQVPIVSIKDLKDRSSVPWMTDDILLMYQKMKETVQKYKDALQAQNVEGRMKPEVMDLKKLAESCKATVEKRVKEAQHEYARKKEASPTVFSRAGDKEKSVQLRPDQIQLVKGLQGFTAQSTGNGNPNSGNAK